MARDLLDTLIAAAAALADKVLFLLATAALAVGINRGEELWLLLALAIAVGAFALPRD